MINYKLHIPSGTRYYCSWTGYMESTWFEYWTTVQLEDSNVKDQFIIWCGKANLMKQIAMKEYKDIRLWKRIEIDSLDIEVVRP